MLVLVDAASVDADDQSRLTASFPDVAFVFASDRTEWLEAASRAEVIFGKNVPAGALERAERLRWLQAGTAGVDGLLRRGLGERHVTLTNARGAHGIPIAENVLAMALCFATRLHWLIRQAPPPPGLHECVIRQKFELHGQTMLVIGLGDIGGTLAMKAKALGMRVLGVRRTDRPEPHCDALFMRDRLPEALAQADHVAVCLPLTPATRGYLGEAELRAMRPTAYVYNVGRGATIVGRVLRRALAEGWIAGAGLDCVEPSDTPAPDDPLWRMENVILSLHTSGSSPYNSMRITDLFMENLARYRRGEPLLNRVDLAQGY